MIEVARTGVLWISENYHSVIRARAGKKGIETMMTEPNLLKEFVVCRVDELRHEEVRVAETTPFYLDLSVSERSLDFA